MERQVSALLARGQVELARKACTKWRDLNIRQPAVRNPPDGTTGS